MQHGRRERRRDPDASLRAEWEADTNKHVEALTELQEALGLPAPPAASSAMTSRTCRARRPRAAWWCLCRACPASRTIAVSASRPWRALTISPPWPRCCERRFARANEQDANAQVAGKGEPLGDHARPGDRGWRQGPAQRGARGDGGSWAWSTSPRRAWPSRKRSCSCRAAPSLDPAAARFAGSVPACSASATRRTALPSPTTATAPEGGRQFAAG